MISEYELYKELCYQRNLESVTIDKFYKYQKRLKQAFYEVNKVNPSYGNLLLFYCEALDLFSREKLDFLNVQLEGNSKMVDMH